jgi:hypothetical protein
MNTQTHTYSGTFDIMNPRAEDVSLDDIAVALSRIARWGGHNRVNITVMQHCMMVADAVSQPAKIHALLHDAAEAYLGDIPAPWKSGVVIYGRPIDIIEEEIMAAIYESIGIDMPTPEIAREVEAADMRQREIERSGIDMDMPGSHAGQWLMRLRVLRRAAAA